MTLVVGERGGHVGPPRSPTKGVNAKKWYQPFVVHIQVLKTS